MSDRPKFCSACGTPVQPDAQFCGRCGARLGGPGLAAASSGGAGNGSAMQALVNRITDTVGLERLEGFSIRALFSEALKRRDPEEMERYLGVGTPETTPPLTAQMGQWPRPWLFLRTLIFALAVYAVLLFTWLEYRNVNVVPALIIVGSFAVPLATLILFFELNTPRNVSILRVVQLVVLGGAVSLLISLWLFRITNLHSWLGPPAAAFVEEVGKLAALLVLARFAHQERYAFTLNGLLFGAAVGTGFAAFESAGYALRFGLRSTDLMTEIITLRGVLSPFGHIAWTAIAACALWRVRAEGVPLAQAIFHRKFLVLFAVPVVLHFIWNSPIQLPLFGKFIILGFLAYVVIFSLVQSGLREVQRTASPAQLDFEAGELADKPDPVTVMRTIVRSPAYSTAAAMRTETPTTSSAPTTPGVAAIDIDPSAAAPAPHRKQ
jgi:protease PrsW